MRSDRGKPGVTARPRRVHEPTPARSVRPVTAAGPAFHHGVDHHCAKDHRFCERLNRTLKEKFFSVGYRKTALESVPQLQADLERFHQCYNEERSRQDQPTQGRTPRQAFQDGLAAMSLASAA